MALPYQVLGEFTGSVESGSYLNVQDTSLFYVSQSTDIWFGISQNDVVEFAAYSTDDLSLTQWGTLDEQKQFQTVNLSFFDDLNIIHSYSYDELIQTFIIYKNSEILLKPSDDLNALGITDGNFVVSYNFTRQMAGTPVNPLTVKDISPSRTEIKLIPAGSSDVFYNAFCLKKLAIRDVAPVLLNITRDLPFDKIYQSMKPTYQAGISFLQFVFFLPDDGSVVQFLRNLYEDQIKYTQLSQELLDSGLEPTRISRIQGIRSFFSNFLLQNFNQISDFDAIEQQFISFTNTRIDQKFGQIKGVNNTDYTNSRQFVYDFFVKFAYGNIVHPLQTSYQDKYFGFFKNALNFGNNNYYQILTHDFLDERQSPTDPLTLLIKLGSELPSNIAQKDNCWVSNFGMAPFTFTLLLQNPVKFQTIKISPPNFGAPSQFINRGSVNKLYSADDLALQPNVQDNVTLNRNTAFLNTDYTDFSNFIVFSSAAVRINIFKNKVIQWSILSASLSTLNTTYLASLSSSVTYPYYSNENALLTGQMDDIINSFDGFESFLFNSGSYQYSITANSFINTLYVENQDLSASAYDQTNRDSLISNAPQYIQEDQNNEEYLTFLQMAGHHFDNIYIYIAALPIERQVKNQLSSSIPSNTLKELLYSFGWNVDDIIGSLDIDEVYLNSMDSASYNSISAQDRLQTIWNRLLVNLPGIYKTKGTEECVNYLMACYGLPTSLISIREYGGTDFAFDTKPTYKLDEKTYMASFSGSANYIEGPIPLTTHTVEFKFSIDPFSTASYHNFTVFPLFTTIPFPYSSSVNASWYVGFYRVPGQMTGQIVFQMGSGSTGASITSSVLPIFNGEIFSVMVRRNEPNEEFEFSPNIDVQPVEYDLVVQRNEDGRKIFYSTSSLNLYDQDNVVFDQFGKFRLGNSDFVGTLDKLSIWTLPILDLDFEEHVNDLNSYGFSGSIAFQDLWVHLSWEYPQNLYFNLSGSSVFWVDNRSPYYAIPNYYSTASNLSSSKVPSLFSGSQKIIQTRWQSEYPTGSVEIRAYGFPQILGENFSASFNGCNFISTSAYPYNFVELTYQQDIDASKYGPNKYKNKKIRQIVYDVNARLDVNDRSTSEPDLTVSGESNQLGFFIDPQDSKNKDIIRYVGKFGIMELIGDPSNLYSDRYYDLVNKNHEYNEFGNKKTLFNELLTIYKFYFDKSIFQAIKNVLPARANAYTGVVIEPTLLERPKYQNRPITSSINPTFQSQSIVSNIYTFGMDALWVNFNTDLSQLSPQTQQSLMATMPPNYSQIIDLTYVNDGVKIRNANLNRGYITDLMDKYQFGFFPDFEGIARYWEIQNLQFSATASSYTVPIYGSVTQQKQGDRMQVGPDHGVYDTTKFFSGLNQDNHPIIYYMMKVWKQYFYDAKTGEYVRSDNPSADTYASASVFLYEYVILDEHYMRTIVYLTNEVSRSVYDPTDISYNYSGLVPPGVSGMYLHAVNTFIDTPDQTVSNVVAVPNGLTPFNPTSFDLGVLPVPKYFEIAKGYPRNHYTHKMEKFSKTRYVNSDGTLYTKGEQTIDTTVNEAGINDGTFPVQSFNVSNVNVVNSTNVIQFVPSTKAGQVLPSSLQQGSSTGGTPPVGGNSSGGGGGVPPPSG